MALSAEQQADLQRQLQSAVSACNDRCLYFAAKWAAELLNSFSNDEPSAPADESDTEVDDDSQASSFVQESQSKGREARLEARETSKYLMAKAFFDCREYARCTAVFIPSSAPYTNPLRQTLSPASLQGTPNSQSKTATGNIHSRKARSRPTSARLSQKALFLALYAQYLTGEKRRNEDSEAILGPLDGPATLNREIPAILSVLEEYFASRGGLHELSNSQGWLDYLYGLCLLKSKSEPLAKQWLLRSVNLNPFNWSAWLELSSLLGSLEELQQISEHLPRNIMTFFFHIYCSQELYLQSPEVYNSLAQMQAYFPASAFLTQQKALLHYHGRDHDMAMQLFDSILNKHPHRLDSMEIYSNLLYVAPNQPRMASLAAMASDTDKFRPETNCILGNYYSMRGEHEKAVLHFRRALTLDRSFQAAWTLMGHEYVELKNTQAAIESYRRAVDINRKDYRAWYGLGQGYEMLDCYSYSLFYHQRAAALCPSDPKMWAAVGTAFAKCGKVRNAIQAYKRALVVGAQVDTMSSFGSNASSDPLAQMVGGVVDPQILYEIALLYEREEQFEEAAAYMELTLAQEDGPDESTEGLGVTQITSRARLWLARWSYSRGEWQRTMDLANELCPDGIEVEEAKSLVKDVRARFLQAQEEMEEDEMAEEE